MIRSKKKGIAKRALSVSLAAAMLLTSNVSAWAAFEAEPVDAEFANEAFETVDDPVLLASLGDVTFKKNGNAITEVNASELTNTDAITVEIDMSGATAKNY